MTSKEIRNMTLTKGDKTTNVLLREIAATLAEFNERAKRAEPLALELATLSLDGMKKLQAEALKDLQ